MEKQWIQTGAPWEEVVQYSRAIRVGNRIEVAGTTAMKGDEIVGAGDVAQQTRYILETIGNCLEQLGASLHDVIRTRIYVTNIDDWETIGAIHGEFFKGIKPVATLIEVSKLIHPALRIEIEASAVITSRG